MDVIGRIPFTDACRITIAKIIGNWLSLLVCNNQNETNMLLKDTMID